MLLHATPPRGTCPPDAPTVVRPGVSPLPTSAASDRSFEAGR
ncbi:hypothetical protein [Methylobacterium sp. V23]|nr:hypothetical protein [Methylobacterium sp. V23]